MNKQETIEMINRLPTFSKLDVAVNGFPQKKYVGIVEDGQDQAINIPSTRYQLVQLKDILLPAQESLTEYDSRLIYYDGKVILDLFPTGDEYKDGDFTYGLSVFNSVTSETGIGVRFNVLYKNRVLRVPSRSIGRFYKSHSNKMALVITKDYLQLIDKVKDSWKVIVSEFPKIVIRPEELVSLGESFNLSDDLIDEITKTQALRPINLWEIVMMRFDEIAKGRNKSEIHMAEKYDDLTNQIWAYALAMRISI